MTIPPRRLPARAPTLPKTVTNMDVRRHLSWTRTVASGGGPIVLVVLFVVFSLVLPGTFFTAVNLQSMISAQAVPGILALALVLPLAANEFDFSGGSVASAASVFFVVLVGQFGLPWGVAGVIILAGSALIGLVNGMLVAVFKYGSFVATLAVGGVVAGLTLLQTNGLTLYSGIPSDFTNLGQFNLLGLPLPAWALIVVFLSVGYLMRQTAWGRYQDAIGKGRAAVTLAGVSVRSHLIVSFVLSASLGGFAGLVLVARLASAPANIGEAYTLSAFAAVFLGATMLRPGFFNASGTLVAILLIAVGINGLTLAGAPSSIEQIFTGGVLILAVGLSKLERTGRR